MRLDFGTCLWMFQVSLGASKRGSSDFKLSTLKIVVEKSSPTPFPSKQFWKFLRKERMKNKFRAKRVRFEIRLKKRFVFKFSSRVRTLLLLLAEFFFRELSFSSDFASSSKILFDLSWSKTSSFFIWKRTLKKWRSLFFSSSMFSLVKNCCIVMLWFKFLDSFFRPRHFFPKRFDLAELLVRRKNKVSCLVSNHSQPRFHFKNHPRLVSFSPGLSLN